MIKISNNIQSGLVDKQSQRNLRHTPGKSVRLSHEAVSEIPNWEELRQYARDVKAHIFSRLDHSLKMLEQKLREIRPFLVRWVGFCACWHTLFSNVMEDTIIRVLKR